MEGARESDAPSFGAFFLIGARAVMGKRARGGDANALRAAVGKGSSNASTIAHRKFACGEALFERYYRAQRVTASEGDDFQALMRALATPLPATFRAHAREEMGGDVSRALAAIGEGSVREVFPGAWEAANPTGETKRGRSVVPREVLEVFEEASTSGRGSRQEIVSMLPVLALNPPSGAKVLDVCAAPGQKTMQLLERARYGERGAEGVVHANDAHPGRVRTLLDAIERHGRDPRELVGLFVTRAFGQDLHFPLFLRRGHDVRREQGRMSRMSDSDERREALIELGGYTHVLADVPCSGDGTIRKDPDCLTRWHPGIGNALHITQLSVARRCARLLKPGGTMVYSTCTFNPIEDEAVVQTLLNDDELALELETLDLPISGRPGLREWKVGEHSDTSDEDGDVTLKWFDSPTDAASRAKGTYAPSMWPLAPSRLAELKLERCARFLPHDSNTGGFFVAKLKKKNDQRTKCAFAELVERELALRCDGSTTSKMKPLAKKQAVERMDAQLARFVPLHRVNKELHASIHERLCGSNANLSINGDDVHVACATSSALLDKACSDVVRLAAAGVSLCSASLNASVTLQGADALRHHVGEKLPSSWIPCLPSELHHLLTSERSTALTSDAVFERTRKRARKSPEGAVVFCLRNKSNEIVFSVPGALYRTPDGDFVEVGERANALRGELTAKLRRVASGGRKRGDKRARRLHGLDT